ncbi:hypothetical protein G3A43_07245 [Paraburkholderia aspalathi]|nr:TraU family protein [Paraburkholderia aspalathi]MBK3780048.1 hypothetical protein [Paraburkholderia aspalathi]
MMSNFFKRARTQLNRVSRKAMGLVALTLAFAVPVAHAGTPGCVGKMWNPLTDLDFRDMGAIKIVGFSLMQAPNLIGEPPEHVVPDICFCKNGLQTGFGLGMTFWTPSYINDMARQAGCIGFLDGINILPGFKSLSSGQEYNMHAMKKDGTTNMQVHWAFADITAIAGKDLFEKCNIVSGSMEISYLTEPDFVWQNDVYSAIMTPQVAILAESALLSQMACGVEAMANTLGDWQDMGLCAWAGARMPLDGVTIGKDSAQVSNMDITIKYMARAALLGTTLKTMGKDAVCAPVYSPFYDPFQDRFQWAFPGKVTTRFNQNLLMWGMFIKDAGQGSMMSLSSISSQVASTNADAAAGTTQTVSGTDTPAGLSTSTSAPTAQVLSVANQIMSSIPKPLNYPTKEAGYMQVWEARGCCLVVLTIQTVIQMIANMLLGGIDNQQIQQLLELYNEAMTLYNDVNTAISFLKDPIGGVLSLVGTGISNALGSIGSGLSNSLSNLGGGGSGGFVSPSFDTALLSPHDLIIGSITHART